MPETEQIEHASPICSICSMRDEAAAADVVSRDGCPPLRHWDVVVVEFGSGRRTFVVLPQREGTGIAAKMLRPDGTLDDEPWILEARHFRTGWAKLGRYWLPVKKFTRRPGFLERLFG